MPETIRLRLLAFATAADALGGGEHEMEMEAGSTVADLRARLDRDHPALAGLWPRLAVAVDGRLAGPDAALPDGAEVALLPPVSGGSGGGAGGGDADGTEGGSERGTGPEGTGAKGAGAKGAEAKEAGAEEAGAERTGAKRTGAAATGTAPSPAGAGGFLVDGPLDVAAAVARVSSPRRGAVVAFLGTVRDHHQGRPVGHLVYDAYRPMAEAALARIVADLEAAHRELAAVILHRLGEVPAGEPSVVIAIASPHRAGAYEASRTALERLKTEVPIWKREHYADGGAAWREEEPLTPAAPLQSS